MDSSETAQPKAELAAKVADADAVVLVWDATRPLTLEHCESFWLPYLAARTDVPVVLVANKVDDDEDSGPNARRNHRQIHTPNEDESSGDDDYGVGESEAANSSQSGAERLAAVAAVVAQFRAQVVACYQCSAKTHAGVAEVFFAAQHAVAHPVSPLLDLATGKLTLRAATALRRIFRYFDQDCDGVLSLTSFSAGAAGASKGGVDEISELQRFQMDCFSTPLRSNELQALAQLVAEQTQGKGLARIHSRHNGSSSGRSSAEGGSHRFDDSLATEWSVHDTGINVDGFLALFEELASQQRWEAAWMVLRRFGYDLHYFNTSSSSSSSRSGTIDDFLGEIALSPEARAHGAYLPPKPTHLPGTEPSHHHYVNSSMRLGLSSAAEAFLTRVFEQHSTVSKQQQASSSPRNSRLNEGGVVEGSSRNANKNAGYLTTKALAIIFSAVPGYGNGDEELEIIDESSDTSGVDSDTNAGGASLLASAAAAAAEPCTRTGARMVEASAPWDFTGGWRKGPPRRVLLWAPQAGRLPNSLMMTSSSSSSWREQRRRRGSGEACGGAISRSSSGGTLTPPPQPSGSQPIDHSSSSPSPPPPGVGSSEPFRASLRPAPSPSAASTSPEGAPPQVAHSRILRGGRPAGAEEDVPMASGDDNDEDGDGDDDGERVWLEAWLGAWRASALLDPSCTAKHLTYLGYCTGPRDQTAGTPVVAPQGQSLSGAGTFDNEENAAPSSFVPPLVWCPSPSVEWTRRASLSSNGKNSSRTQISTNSGGACSDGHGVLPRSAIVVHGLVLGSPGCGKTALLRRLCAPTSGNAPPLAADPHRRPWSAYCALSLRPEDVPACDGGDSTRGGGSSASASGNTVSTGDVGTGAGPSPSSCPPPAVLVLTEGSGIEAQHMCNASLRPADTSSDADISSSSYCSLLGEPGSPVDVVLLCFDASDPNSLAYALDLESRLAPSLPRLLVGTKEDLCPMPLPSDRDPMSHVHSSVSGSSSRQRDDGSRVNGAADTSPTMGTAHSRSVVSDSGLHRTSSNGAPGTWTLAQRHCVARELPLPLPTSSVSRRNTEAIMPGSLSRRAVHAALDPTTAKPLQRSAATARSARRWQHYLVAGATGVAAIAAASAMVWQQQGALFARAQDLWPSLKGMWQNLVQSSILDSSFAAVARFQPKRLTQRS